MLVEMMIASTLLVVGLFGVFAVLSQSLGLNRVAANQYIASHLAAEGIEVTKNILDTNFINQDPWNVGFGDGVYTVAFDSAELEETSEDESRQPFLRYSESSKQYGYSSSWDQTSFKREISIENISTDEIKVTSRVYWSDRGGIDFDVTVEDRFMNWRE